MNRPLQENLFQGQHQRLDFSLTFSEKVEHVQLLNILFNPILEFDRIRLKKERKTRQTKLESVNQSEERKILLRVNKSKN